ncbi:MAG: hypothetical protein ACI87O_001797 [Planctomycetota bacterium]|jgi:hypothetical protein
MTHKVRRTGTYRLFAPLGACLAGQLQSAMQRNWEA